MLRAFFRALFDAIREYFQEQRLERDYREALVENAKRDAEKKQRESEAATKERMKDVEAALGDDPAAIREWLRSRDPNTR